MAERIAGAAHFMLDRPGLDDDPPLCCEVEQVRAALGRVAELIGGAVRTASLG